MFHKLEYYTVIKGKLSMIIFIIPLNNSPCVNIYGVAQQNILVLQFEAFPEDGCKV